MAIELPTFRLEAGELLQHVSRTGYRGKPLYYGSDGTNRYDAPARDYGVLYLGANLPTALMESVFHKHHWDTDTRRSIALAEVKSRLVRAVGILADLHLADVTAEGVMAGHFGLNAEQLVTRDYTHTQKVSAQVHAKMGPADDPSFDGVLYPSRNNFPSKAVALFDHASAKVTVIDDINLMDHVDWPVFVKKYRIGVEDDPGPVPPEP